MTKNCSLLLFVCLFFVFVGLIYVFHSWLAITRNLFTAVVVIVIVVVVVNGT